MNTPGEKGPGKYDAACTAARNMTKAHSVVLIVIGGYAGAGFEVQAIEPVVRDLPMILRKLATDIENGEFTEQLEITE